MINDYLFEIECADEIGYYTLADNISNNLIKMAKSNTNLSKYKDKIKNIEYLKTLNKYYIVVDKFISNQDKSDIKSILAPASVSFKHS